MMDKREKRQEAEAGKRGENEKEDGGEKGE
jgi:hypothetical protein